MKILRYLLVIAIIAYAGWLAWPIIGPLLGGGEGEMAARAGAAAAAESGGGLPRTVLWFAAIGLYVIAALLLGAGNPKAVLAYLFGFAADAALRLAMQAGPVLQDLGGEAGDMMTRSTAAAGGGGLDPQHLMLGLLAVVGLLVLLASRRKRRRREPGQLAI